MGLAKTFLAIGIAIVFALFVGYTLYVVYEAPSYSDFNNSEAYDKAQQQYNLNLFIITAIIGIVAIVLGMFISAEGIGSGLLGGGGVLTIIYGFARSWNYLNKYLKIIILFCILILLIFLGYKKIEKRKESQ